ncbi:MAG: hypothetical protein WCP85_12820, partial [Mariniphaga sp.]
RTFANFTLRTFAVNISDFLDRVSEIRNEEKKKIEKHQKSLFGKDVCLKRVSQKVYFTAKAAKGSQSYAKIKYSDLALCVPLRILLCVPLR